MGNSQRFYRLCSEIVHISNAVAKNQLVPILDYQAVQFLSSLQIQVT